MSDMETIFKLKPDMPVIARCKCHGGMTGKVLTVYPISGTADVLLDVGDRDPICLPATQIEIL